MLKKIIFLFFVFSSVYTYSQNHQYQELSIRLGDALSIGSKSIGRDDNICGIYSKMNIKKMRLLGLISPNDSIFNYSFPSVDTLIVSDANVNLTPFPNVSVLIFYIMIIGERGAKDSLRVITPHPQKIKTVIITESSDNPSPIYLGSSFFELNQLETLYLSTLVYIGPEISKLKQLKCLFMRCNVNRIPYSNPSDFRDSIVNPIDLSYFSSLETLVMPWLEKVQYKQLKTLNIRKLILYSCNLKYLNRYVFSIKNLEELFIHDVHQDIYKKRFIWEQTPSRVSLKGGRIGHNISNLQQLKVFSLGESVVSGIPPDLSFFKPDADPDTLRQRKAYCQGINSTLRFSRQIGTLQNLEILNISNRRRTSIVLPATIKDCKNLQSLTLRGGSLTKIPKLEDMPQLTKLDFASNAIKELNLDLNSLPKLQMIDLSYNPIQMKAIPNELRGKVILK